MTRLRKGAIIGLLMTSSAMMPDFAAADGISGDVIRIGLINDQSGIYSDTGGPGSVEAARMAIEDFGGEINGKKIELVVADDQSKPDIGLGIVQRWIDKEGVDVIAGGSLSSIALAIQKVTADNDKPYLIAGPASSGLMNENCTPMSTQWVLDTYALGKGIIKSMVAEGNDTYFFITVDYTFGKQSQADATRFIEEAGGKVVGYVTHPQNSNDMSAYLLQAQASGAKVIILANAGADFSNAMKQAQEFGIQAGGQKVIALGLQINQVHAIGIDVAQGMSLVTPFYWDRTPETRAFAERFKARFRDRVPNETMSGFYSAITHYLKAVEATGTDEGQAVVAKMHEMPVNDVTMTDVRIRDDGQVMRPMYSVTVKAPSEVREPYDYHRVGDVIAAEDLWRPESESACPLLKPKG